MSAHRSSGLLFLVLAACSGGGPEGSRPSVVVDEGPAAGPIAAGAPGHASRRLTVDMLQASLPVVAGDAAEGGPISWEVVDKGAKKDGFDMFADALGKADYETVTEENRVPSAVYVKLMEDMGRTVCDRMVHADEAKTDPAARVLTRFAGGGSDADVVANVRYLILRFLGDAANDDDPRIAELAKLYADSASPSSSEGWRAVCVALVTQPAFHIY